MKFQIGDLLEDEDGTSGRVVILWNDGDICELENDAAHPNPKIVGHWPMYRKKEEDVCNISQNNKKPKKG